MRGMERFVYLTVIQGKGKKKTIVSIGRRMAVLMYSVLQNKTKYEPRPWKGASENCSVKLAEQAVCA